MAEFESLSSGDEILTNERVLQLYRDDQCSNTRNCIKSIQKAMQNANVRTDCIRSSVRRFFAEYQKRNKNRSRDGDSLEICGTSIQVSKLSMLAEIDPNTVPSRQRSMTRLHGSDWEAKLNTRMRRELNATKEKLADVERIICTLASDNEALKIRLTEIQGKVKRL